MTVSAAVVPVYDAQIQVKTKARTSTSNHVGYLSVSVCGGSLHLLVTNQHDQREGRAAVTIDPSHVDQLIDALQEIRSCGLLRPRQWDRATSAKATGSAS